MFEYKACTLEYFLDFMQPYELAAITEVLEYTTKQEWEQVRFQSYVQAQSQSSKKIKPTDILKFGWEQDNTKKDTSISKEDVERLINKANTVLNGRLSNTSIVG